MIERIEISSEALPRNGIDTGFRNTNDTDFQNACIGAVEEMLQTLFAIHRESIGSVSAKIEYLNDGYAGRVIEMPTGMSDTEREAWKDVEHFLDPGLSDRFAGFRYAMVELVFQGMDLMRIGFLLLGPPSLEDHFKSLVRTCGIMASRAVRLEELRYLSRHDGLTGLASRDLFLKRIADEIASLSSCKSRLMVFEIRVASIEEVNDNFGFNAGDELILETARRLSALHEVKAFVARIGGSKFMLLTRLNSHLSSSLIIRAVRNVLELPVQIEGQDIRMNVDVGCVILDHSGIEPVEVLQRVETAVIDSRSRSFMAHQKAVVYSDKSSRTKKKSSRINLLVRQAYGEKRFSLFFQPLIDLKTKAVVGCEALLRMRDNQGKLFEAARFMPAVSRIRYHTKLDRWVFSEILKTYKSNQALRDLMEKARLTISMNCDPETLTERGLAYEWLKNIERSGFDPRNLVVEVVENPFIFENAEIAKNLNLLQVEKVRIAIDDFGSGYSNLKHLSGLSFDIVKFDRGFMSNFAGAASRQGILLKSMLNLCSELGLVTICEGVETQAHAEFLGSMGCNIAQGYFYGKPTALGGFLAHIKNLRNPAVK